MSNVKKLLILALSIFVLVGVTGCMDVNNNQKSNNANSEINIKKQNEMLEYIKNKYEEEFTIEEFIPAVRGFNDGMNENVLVVKSSEGFLVNVRERVQSPENFYDNYLYVLASGVSKEYINYSIIPTLVTARTYPNIRESNIAYNELKKGFSVLNSINVINISCLVAISKVPDDETMELLYKTYEDMQEKNFNYYNFIIAVTNDVEKTKKYVDNFNLYGITKWDDFDTSITLFVEIREGGLSFNEFKKFFK